MRSGKGKLNSCNLAQTSSRQLARRITKRARRSSRGVSLVRKTERMGYGLLNTRVLVRARENFQSLIGSLCLTGQRLDALHLDQNLSRSL